MGCLGDHRNLLLFYGDGNKASSILLRRKGTARPGPAHLLSSLFANSLSRHSFTMVQAIALPHDGQTWARFSTSTLLFYPQVKMWWPPSISHEVLAARRLMSFSYFLERSEATNEELANIYKYQMALVSSDEGIFPNWVLVDIVVSSWHPQSGGMRKPISSYSRQHSLIRLLDSMSA